MWRAVSFAVVALLQITNCKMCWEECSGMNVLQDVDIHGCRRRSTYPGSQDFRCKGMRGPPCTVLRGDQVELELTWLDNGHRNLTQAVHWQSGWMDLPWVGMETDICKYVNDGKSCPGFGDPLKGGLSTYKFPIDILSVYPAGSYNLKWQLIDRDAPSADGQGAPALCFKFSIRIM